MSLTLRTFCLLIALACFAIATIWTPKWGNLVSAGLFFGTAAVTFG